MEDEPSSNPNLNQAKDPSHHVIAAAPDSAADNTSLHPKLAYISSATRRRTVNYKSGNPVRLFGIGSVVRRPVARSQSLIVRPKSMSSISTLTEETRHKIMPGNI